MRARAITAIQLSRRQLHIVVTAIIVLMVAGFGWACGSVIVFGRTIVAITTDRGQFHVLFAIRSHAANERDWRHQRHPLSENRE